MQGQGSGIDTFPEITDVGLGSIPNNTGMSQQTSLNNMLNPVETRLTSYMATSGEIPCLNSSSHDTNTLTGSGESSSRLNLQNPLDDDMKMEQGWSSSPYSARPMIGQNSEERRVEQDILFPGRGLIGLSGNQNQGGPSFSQGSQSDNLNSGYMGSSGGFGQGMEANTEPYLYKSSGLETEQTSSDGASPDIVGTSSRSSDFMVGENDGNPGSSFGNWGLSCKRKALEGTSEHSYSGGSSSSLPQAENGAWNTGSARYSPSSNLTLSTPLRNSPSGGPLEQQNSRSRVGLRLGASDAFPSLAGVSGNAESPLRQFFIRGGCTGPQQESSPSNLSSQERSTIVAATNSGDPQSQFPAMNMNGSSGNMFPLPWNGASSSRVGSLSSSLVTGTGYRGAELREEANLRSNPRNNVDLSTFATATDMRNSAQDPTVWRLAPADIRTSLGAPSSTRVGSSSGIRSPPNPAWLPLNSPPTDNQQRITEFAPWSLFPSMDSQAGGHSQFNPPPRPASSQDSGSSSGSNNQARHLPHPRSGFLVDRHGDDVLNMPHSLRALAADIEGRRRLVSEIRQVLNAMSRSGNLRVEDYMLLDPFIYHGMAEMHDRHRDMRLDVDNMSYEELLALEERIGDVSTGISEETIAKCMKQRKLFSLTEESPADMEPCCVCQEVYADEDDIGTLDCGHDFHTSCIKQWLMQKNLCPICKTTGLLT